MAEQTSAANGAQRRQGQRGTTAVAVARGIHHLPRLHIGPDAVAGYAMPDTSARDFFELIAGLGLDLPIRHYVGRLAGQPVATSSFFLAAGVAGVQFVSTRPEARGRGVAAAMTRAPLREAQALGYQAGILQSSEMGYRVYERLGFRRVSEVGNYFWKR